MSSFYCSVGFQFQSPAKRPFHFKGRSILNLDESLKDLDFDQDFTVAFWVKIQAISQEDSLPKQVNLAGKPSQGASPFAAGFTTENSLNQKGKVWALRSDGQQSPMLFSVTAIDDGKWHYISYVRQEKLLFLYVDGVFEAFAKGNLAGSTANQSPFIIGNPPGIENGFRGQVDEFRIWSEALSVTDIQTEMKAAKGGSGELVLSLYFNELASKSPLQFKNPIDVKLIKAEGFEQENQVLVEGPEELLKDEQKSGYWSELQTVIKDRREGNPVNVQLGFAIKSALIIASIVGLFYLLIRWRGYLKVRRVEKSEKETQMQLDQKKKELVSKTLHLVNKNAVLKDLKTDLTNYQKNSENSIREIGRIIRTLQMENATETNWEVFQTQFLEMHNDFDKKLRARNEKITDQEIRLAALVKMKLSNKEIAGMLHVQAESVKKSKFRLKKKLMLEADTDLNLFLESL